MSATTCTHYNDSERAECPVCLVSVLTAERDQLSFNINNEMTWASHYLAQSISDKARADKAEAVLSDPQQLHAHCLRNLNEGQIAHLFGERMTAIFNRAERAEADLAAERARLDWLEVCNNIAIDHCTWAEHMPLAGQPIIHLLEMDDDCETSVQEIATAPNLRDAIDAAMKEEVK